MTKWSTLESRKRKAKMKEIMNNDDETSSSSTSKLNSTRKVSRVVGHRLRNRKVWFGMTRGQSARERQAEALALEISFATFASLVNEKKNGSGQNTNVDDLASIYACSIKESLANVYGQRLGSFAERSFNSTLSILKQINAELGNKSKQEVVVTEAERFRTEAEEGMSTMIMLWLVASVSNTLFWTLYGALVSSQRGTSIRYSPSWWNPDEFCRNRVLLQVNFAFLMVLVLAYSIIHRSSGIKRRMPITFNILFLGIVCGLSGKFCVDASGGNGKLWLCLWSILCLLQYVADVFTWPLFCLLHGSDTMVGHITRISFFGVVTMLVLPLNNGLLPFATFGEWKDDLSTNIYAINSLFSRF